jgi:hypothetical protein
MGEMGEQTGPLDELDDASAQLIRETQECFASMRLREISFENFLTRHSMRAEVRERSGDASRRSAAGEGAEAQRIADPDVRFGAC